eukprot:8420895-Alexandrium_andersonii.AAC.1
MGRDLVCSDESLQRATRGALDARASAQNLMLHCMRRLHLACTRGKQYTTWQGNWAGDGLRDKGRHGLSITRVC